MWGEYILAKFVEKIIVSGIPQNLMAVVICVVRFRRTSQVQLLDQAQFQV